MRQYERSGVVVDQCTECRGVFLDRGELERLVDAENEWHGRQSREQGRDYDREQTREYGRERDDRYGERPQQRRPGLADIAGALGQAAQAAQSSRSGHSGSGHYGSGHRRKKSFLDELFG